jgi:excisionase family DNA binding protein
MQRSATQSNESLTVTAKEVMRITGLSQRLTYRLIKQGELPALWCGKGWIVPMPALEEFLMKRAKEESQRLARQHRVTLRDQQKLA